MFKGYELSARKTENKPLSALMSFGVVSIYILIITMIMIIILIIISLFSA